MDGRSLGRLKRELDEFVGELLVDLPRRDQRAWATAYLRGLLLDGERKSVGPMAERLAAIDHERGADRRDYEQALQQFVGQSTWPADAVRDRLQRWLAARGRRRPTDGTPADLLILDDTGFPKQGTSTVGVARQYTGTLGKVAGCQVAVTLQHARQPAAGTAAGGEVFCVDAPAGAGAGGQGSVVGGAELPGDEGRAGAGPLRGAGVGRVAPPRGAGDARVRVRRRPAAAKRGRRDRPRVSVPEARRLMQGLLLCWAGWCPVCGRRVDPGNRGCGQRGPTNADTSERSNTRGG